MVEYFDYNIVFLAEYAADLLKHTRMNNHTIKLKVSKQLLFGSIYSLEPIELETLKIYLETNLANGFIRLFKSFIRIPILFNQKPNKSLYLYIDYQDLNNQLSKTNIYYSLLKNCWINLAGLRDLPN